MQRRSRPATHSRNEQTKAKHSALHQAAPQSACKQYSSRRPHDRPKTHQPLAHQAPADPPEAHAWKSWNMNPPEQRRTLPRRLGSMPPHDQDRCGSIPSPPHRVATRLPTPTKFARPHQHKTPQPPTTSRPASAQTAIHAHALPQSQHGPTSDQESPDHFAQPTIQADPHRFARVAAIFRPAIALGPFGCRVSFARNIAVARADPAKCR